MILLISSITPVIIFLYLIYIKDQIKEPNALLAKCFLGGFLSIILTLIIALPISYFGSVFQTPLLRSLYNAFCCAAIPEELSKFVILYWVVWKSKDFDHHYDGIVYAVFVSLGFALVENILYVFEHGFTTAILRAVLAVPGHGFFGVIMGYYLSLSKFNVGEEKRNLIQKSILIPILFHGLYDFLLMYSSANNENNVLLSIVLLIAFTFLVIKLWSVGLKKIKLHATEVVIKEIVIETIPAPK